MSIQKKKQTAINIIKNIYTVKIQIKTMHSDPATNLSNTINYRSNRLTGHSNIFNRDSGTYARQRSRSPQSVLRVLNANQNGLNYSGLHNASSNPIHSNSNNYPINSEAIRKLVDEACMYPVGFGDLLKNQDKNIKSFKMQISKEKDKIDEDIASFKIQVNHTLEDLRLSLHANLDRVYQSFLQKSSKFRGQLFQINRLKQTMQLQLGSTSLVQLQAKVKIDAPNRPKNLSQHEIDHYDSSSPVLQHASIQQQKVQTISNMQIGNKQYKKYLILNYIADMQRDRVNAVNQLQKQLIILNAYEHGYYQSKQFLKVLANLRDLLSKQVRKVYQNNFRYIRNLNSVVAKHKQNTARVLQTTQLNPHSNKQANPFVPINTTVQITPTQVAVTIPAQLPPPIQVITQPPVTIIPQPIQIQQIQRPSSNIYGRISNSQQSLKVSSAQSINIIEESINIQLPTSLGIQTALCGIFLNNQIAVGLKNGTIQIFSCDGHNIATLKQHKASICCLSIIRTNNQNYLVSGSDVGCCRVIVWDPVTWQPNQVHVVHQGAITGIIDLEDQSNIVSAGYDKKINLINVQQNNVALNGIPSESPITGLIKNKNSSKLVASCLDKAMYVWQIVRDYRLKTQNIILERKIQNNCKISGMVCSQILPELIVIATQDAKIKLVNIQKGQSYKTVSLSSQPQIFGSVTIPNNFPLQLTIIQRQSKPYYPIALVWPYNEHKIYQANTQTNLVSVKNINTSTHNGVLEFGYGVSPKCFYVGVDAGTSGGRGVLVYTVNQKIDAFGKNTNCVSVYRIQEYK